MAGTSNSAVQNLLPVQAYFNLDGTFNTFIGQNKPFYATSNPVQSGLTITNSTLDSSPIGSTSPSTGVFTNISTTTGTISTQPSAATDIVNLLALQSYAAGISWKQPCAVATLANITLLGLQTIDGYTTLAGDRVLVKNQSTAANNGIYIASATAWTRSLDASTWNELISAISFIEYGTQAGGAWFCTAQPGGTLGVTAVNWSQFTTSATYSAGTGLTLTGSQFSITPVGTAGTYGSASQVPVIVTNASGQVSSVTNTSIAITGSQVSGNISGNAANVTGIVAVANGGTGASTLTGYLYGNGTSAVTASTSIPTTALSGTVTNAQLANSSITVNGTAISLGGSGTITAANPNALTIGTGLSGTSYTGSAAVTIAIDSTVATLTGIQTLTNKTISGASNTLSNIGNSSLTNSAITFGTTSQALGSTVSALNAVSIGATTASTAAFTYLSTSSTTSTTPTLGFNASNAPIAMGATISGSYLQAMLQNKSGTANASTNYVLSNDLGTDSTYYGEFGMNSSVFSASTPSDFFSINNGVYFSGHDGDITVGSGNGFKTYLAWGTTGQSAHVINASGAIGLSTNLGTTPATSGTSGFGTSGQVLTSGGSGAAPTWTTIVSGLTITDNTSSSSTYYPTMETATSGTATSLYTSSTKFSFVPSTGALSATSFVGSGSSLTNIPTSIVAGTGISVSGATGAVTVTNTAAATSWQSVQASSFSATAGNGYPVNTTSASITATLPASPTAGQIISFVDYAGTWGTNNFIINPNGNKFNGMAINATCATSKEGILIIYADSTRGWIPYAGINASTPAQTYTVTYLVVSGGGGGGTGATGVGAQPNGGGGGGGGVQTGTVSVSAGTAYAITVGGAGSVSSTGNPTDGLGVSTSGGNPQSGRTGGSSGSPTSFGGGGGGNYSGGGGGGAAGNGGGAPGSTTGGNGGSGLLVSGFAQFGDTANLGYYAGGGGGGQGSSGGIGGGGNGGNGNPGQANTGGGGGGGYGTPGGGSGGGSGVYIIKYAGSQIGTGGTVSSLGGYTYHLFTTSGTYTA